MCSRIAGRLVTGPLAFLLGGIIDVSSFALGSLRARLTCLVSRRRGS